MKKRIVIIGLIIVIALGIVSIYGTLASNSPVSVNTDDTYNVTLNDDSIISVPAGSSKTVFYQVTNTNKGVVKYGVAYSGDNITVKVYYDSIDKETGLFDYGESKYIKLYISNSGDTESTVSLKTVLGYEKGGELDTVVPAGYTLVTEECQITAYAVYSADDNSLTFYKTFDTISVGDIYNGKTVTAVYTGVEDLKYGSSELIPWHSYSENITNVTIKNKISPISTAFWFANFKNCKEMDLSKLDTSKVTSMMEMFSRVGQNSTTTFSLDLSNLDVSSVTNMQYMFQFVGYNSATVELIGLDNWDVSNVTYMNNMFHQVGENATTWSIGDLSNWDISSVTNMSSMFHQAGQYATTWAIGDLSKWDTSNVTDMSYMFYRVGQNSTTFKLIGLDNWNVSNVENMDSMFYRVGSSATTWIFSDLSKWNTSNVTNMNSMFYNAGTNAAYTLDLSTKIVTRDDGTTYTAWDVSKVTNHSNFDAGVTGKIVDPSWAS